MQLSVKHQFAFLCIPKCGSTSIEHAIRPYCETKLGGDASLKHIPASKFARHIRPLLWRVDKDNLFETFCIMRDPLDRVRSWYQYRSRTKLKEAGKTRSHRYTGNLSYAEFVEAFLEGDNEAAAGVGSQLGFVTLNDGSIGVNRIFRLDQMETITDFLSTKIGTEIEIPVANKSDAEKTKSGSFELPGDLIARLQERLKPDYALFNQLPWNSAIQGTKLHQ